MKHILTILLLLSFLMPHSGVKKCDLSLEHNLRYPRPDLHTYCDSPSGNFRVHYDTYGDDAPDMSDTDGDGCPDYIEAVGETADYVRLVITDMMGFNQEAPDDNGIYDIYIEDMSYLYYGVNHAADTFDDGTSYCSNWNGNYCTNVNWNGYTGRESFLIIDNAYEASDFETTGIEGMQITLAHEFFHAVQRTYPNNVNDMYFWELSSTWIEDVIFPEGNDYLNWAFPYLQDPELNISSYEPNSNYDAGYSLALFGHYLTNIFDEGEAQDSDIMRLIWEAFDGDYRGQARDAMDLVLINHYNSTFSDAWTDFNARNIFNGAFNDSYNNIYYHNDQKDINPLTTSPTYIEYNNLNPAIYSQEGKATILSWDFENIDKFLNSFDNMTNFDIDDDFKGYIAIKSLNPNFNRIYSMHHILDLSNNNQNLSIDPYDVAHLIVSKNGSQNEDYSNTDYLVFEGQLNSFNSFVQGNLNLDNIDTVDILDLVLLIDVVLQRINVSEYQFDLVDGNQDDLLNIIDVVTLIDLILD